MNTGYLRTTDGNEYFFSSMIYNSWTKKREYLIGDNWITEDSVIRVTFLLKAS